MPVAGDLYESTVIQTFDETLSASISSETIPDVGLDVELQEVDLSADAFFPGGTSIRAGSLTLQPHLLDFAGANATFLSWLGSTLLHAGDFVEGNYARPAAGGVRLDLFGRWRSQLPPPPPPLGAWCEPFIPTDADTADEIYTAHLDRMDALSASF